MESELASLQQFICGINICQLLHMQGCLRDGSHKALLKTVPTLIFFFSVNDTSISPVTQVLELSLSFTFIYHPTSNLSENVLGLSLK